MANNFAPTVTVKNTNVEIGASVLFKDLFEANDLDGNAITRYRFRDNGSASFSGFFSLAALRQLPDEHERGVGDAFRARLRGWRKQRRGAPGDRHT